MKRILKHIRLKYIVFKNRKNNIRVANGASVSRVKFEGCNSVGANTVLSGKIGYGSYTGPNCYIIGEIGRFCSIASEVRTILGNHPTRDFVSTSPCFYSTDKQNGESFVTENRFSEVKTVHDKCPVVIEDDVWIGEHASILAGITIGTGSIVAAGAVVTKDVAPYSIVAGVPAREIRKRFSDENISYLLRLRWWDKPIEWIKENAELFDNIEKLKKAFPLD